MVSYLEIQNIKDINGLQKHEAMKIAKEYFK
jgi:hypothetical protein